MQTRMLLGAVALSVVLSGCATGRVASYYDHPDPAKQTIGERWGDFAACRFATGVEYGERVDRCLTAKGYTPIYAD